MLYAAIFYLLKTPKAYEALTRELRNSFKTYNDVTHEALVRLPYLTAVIHETLRIFMTSPNGMPRISPGATVDGQYVPKGVSPPLHSHPTHIYSLLLQTRSSS